VSGSADNEGTVDVHVTVEHAHRLAGHLLAQHVGVVVVREGDRRIAEFF